MDLLPNLQRTVIYQPDADSAGATWRRAADGFLRDGLDLRNLLDEVLAYLAFPAEHSRQIWSSNSQDHLSPDPSPRCWGSRTPVTSL